jgi:hypothetical protein
VSGGIVREWWLGLDRGWKATVLGLVLAAVVELAVHGGLL